MTRVAGSMPPLDEGPRVDVVLENIRLLLEPLLTKALRKDYYGTLTLAVHIQDGSVNHFKRGEDQIFK